MPIAAPDDPPAPAVVVRGLRIRYGAREVLHGIDLAVPAGTVYGILGPNGAGKTTTLELLEGHRRPTQGSIRVLGHDPRSGGVAFRERIGIVLQDGGVEPYLTVAEILDATRRSYPAPRSREDLLDTVGLTDQAGTRVRRLSAGQRRRLELALALAGDPELLFLDEPTVGFDPEARQAAWEAIRRFTRRGRTVILATNLMEEAQALADRVAIFVGGRVVAEGPPIEVVGGDRPGSTVRFRLPSADTSLPPEITRTMVAAHEGQIELRTNDPAMLLRELTSWALRNDLRLLDLTVAPRSLEDAYLELTAAAAPRSEPEAEAPDPSGRTSEAEAQAGDRASDAAARPPSVPRRQQARPVAARPPGARPVDADPLTPERHAP